VFYGLPYGIEFNFFIINPTRCTNFTNLFWHETLHVSDSSSVPHQEFIHCTLSSGICHTGLWTALEQDQDGTAVPSWSCSKAVFKPVWHTIAACTVNKLLMMDDELSETCRVSCQNKFVKLMHLVGTGAGHLWVRWWTFGLQKCGEFLDYLQNQLASQEGLGSMEWVSK